jgi:hypothetical protein
LSGVRLKDFTASPSSPSTLKEPLRGCEEGATASKKAEGEMAPCEVKLIQW